LKGARAGRLGLRRRPTTHPPEIAASRPFGPLLAITDWGARYLDKSEQPEIPKVRRLPRGSGDGLTFHKYNFYIVSVKIESILFLEDGPAKTAAVVAWIQGLFNDEVETPVLVGGAAVELYSAGAYTTGDIDLVGSVPSRVERTLRAAGFERHGRHWVHEAAQLFVEFPGRALGEDERAVWRNIGEHRIRIVSPEDLLVDRLGAWQYWRSSVDGVNVWLLWRALEDTIDLARLEARVRSAGWTDALQSLRRFAQGCENTLPSAEEVETWANAGPS